MRNKQANISFKKISVILTTVVLFICTEGIFAQEEKPLSYYQIIEERNFFRPKEVIKKATQPEIEVTDKESRNDKFILTGIVEINGRFKAIIEKSSGEGFYVEEKENVEDYVVDKISQNTVTLKKGDEEVILKLKKAKPQQENISRNIQEEKKAKKKAIKEIEYKATPMQMLRKGNVKNNKEE